MKDIISSKYKQLLWKDELGDDFLLIQYAEIYKYSDKILRMLIWKPKKAVQLRKMGLILHEIELSDGLGLYDIAVENLDKVIELGNFKRRPARKGKWFKGKEELLAHKIIVFNPQLRNNNENL